MKKILLVSSLLFSINSHATQLHTYNDVVMAINNGIPIRIVTDFAQCQTSQKNAFTGMLVGSFSPNEIGVTENHIATAMTHFTLNDPFFPGKPVYEHDRYTLTPDNKLIVTFQVLDAANYTKLMEPMIFTCNFDGATKIYS